MAVRGVRRVAEPDIPIPAALTLERAVMPNEDRIAESVRTLIRGDDPPSTG
jgi:pyruvate/2-oxoglutarate/acetoin dehydrogenase E1 component